MNDTLEEADKQYPCIQLCLSTLNHKLTVHSFSLLVFRISTYDDDEALIGLQLLT